MVSTYAQIQFSDSDVVNPMDFIPEGEFNSYNTRPFLLHDHGFPVAVVFASCLQDALDEAADADKLDRYLVSEEDLKDYPNEEEGLTFLGNAGEPFDIESLSVLELPNPRFSFCALMEAHHVEEVQISVLKDVMERRKQEG